MTLIIRAYTDQDAEGFAAAHYAAVHQTAAPFYDQSVLDAWSPPIDEDRLNKIRASAANEVRVIAELDGAIAGFGCLVPENNELRACYVSPLYGRQGIGHKIVEKLEGLAKEHKCVFLWLVASLNAKAFYEDCGYKVLEKSTHTFENGAVIDCYKMEKHFNVPS